MSDELQIPAVSPLLKAAQRTSGRSVPQLAVDTGLSPATIHIALRGTRYTSGIERAVEPPDRTVVLLATVLGVTPQQLRDVGRRRAAVLMEALPDDDLEVSSMRGDVESAREVTLRQEAAARAREEVLRQVLAAFTDEELGRELERRRRISGDEDGS